MAYTPRNFTKIVRDRDTGLPETRTQVAYSLAEAVQLIFDGYTAGTPVTPPASLSDRLALLESTGIVLPPATTTVPGKVQLATPDETVEGEVDDKVVTPSGLSQAIVAHQVELNAAEYGAGPGKTGAENWTALNGLFNTTVRGLIDAGTPVKVVIPPGDYPMSKGLYAQFGAGKGGLHVSAYGARLVFDTVPTGSWAMFKVRPLTGWTIGTPPANTTGYLRDIYIEGLGILDLDPVGHKGDEETHGINVAYAKNVHIWNCVIEGTGDEPIEVDYVEDFTIHDNHLRNCKGTEGAIQDGANISVKNGCKRGKVYANTIDTSVGLGSKGIQVKIIEAAAVEDIEVYANTIRNVAHSGLWLNTTGAAARRISFHDNTVDGTVTGIGMTGTGVVDDCSWRANTVRNCTGSGTQLVLQGASIGNRFDSNRISDCGTAGTATTTYGAWLGSTAVGGWASVHGNMFRNIQGRGIYLTGDGIKVSGGEVRNANLAGTANYPAIGKSAGVGQIVDGVTIVSSGPRGIQAIDYVRGCTVTGNTGDAAVSGAKEISGGYYAGRVSGLQSGGAILNAEIDATGYTTGNAVDLGTATDCRVVGNKIRAYAAGGRRPWNESAGADRNLFANNLYFGAPTVVGAASVSSANIAMAA